MCRDRYCLHCGKTNHVIEKCLDRFGKTAQINQVISDKVVILLSLFFSPLVRLEIQS